MKITIRVPGEESAELGERDDPDELTAAILSDDPERVRDAIALSYAGEDARCAITTPKHEHATVTDGDRVLWSGWLNASSDGQPVPGALTVTPSGYQGPAQHTWTAGCAGFHEPGPCPLPPKWAPADWSAMLGQLAGIVAQWERWGDSAFSNYENGDALAGEEARVLRGCASQLRDAIGQPS